MTRPDMGVVTVGLAKVDIVGDSGVDDSWGGDRRVGGSWVVTVVGGGYYNNHN